MVKGCRGGGGRGELVVLDDIVWGVSLPPPSSMECFDLKRCCTAARAWSAGHSHTLFDRARSLRACGTDITPTHVGTLGTFTPSPTFPLWASVQTVRAAASQSYAMLC